MAHAPLLEELAAREDFWQPVEEDGSNFRTYRLRKPSEHRLEFRASVQKLLFCGVFISICLFMVVMALLILLGVIPATGENGRDASLSGGMTFGLIGLLFGAIGALMLHGALQTIVFDKDRGLTWRGRDPRDRTSDERNEDICFRLEEIVALQLLAERVQVKRSSYLSHELNLVLRSGERLNLVDHVREKILVDEAETLGHFLDVPVLRRPAA